MNRQRIYWSDGDWEPGAAAMSYIKIDPPLTMKKSGNIWLGECQDGEVVALIEYSDGDIGVYRGTAELST